MNNSFFFVIGGHLGFFFDNRSPLYSVDYTLRDCYLFLQIKNELREIYYMNAEEAVAAFQTAVEEVSKKGRAKCFTQRFYRIKKCIYIFISRFIF